MVLALETAMLTLWNGFVGSLPGLVAAIVTLIIGFILGKVIGRIVREILIRARIDQYVIEGKKIVFKLSDVFSVVARWWIYLVFIQQAAVFLGVLAITGFVNSIITFIPLLVEAGLIVIVGYIIAEYLKDRIIASRTLYGGIIGKVVFFLLVYLSIALALPVVGIDATLVNWIMIILVGSIGLGMAIALGLGLKDAVAQVAKKYTTSYRKRR